jgi:hypothetical protein
MDRASACQTFLTFYYFSFFSDSDMVYYSQCARRGLRCERPTESRRGVRKSRKIPSDGAEEQDKAAAGGAVLMELVPRRQKGSGGRKTRTEQSSHVERRTTDFNVDMDAEGEPDTDMHTVDEN